jgi:hypothetical protein
LAHALEIINTYFNSSQSHAIKYKAKLIYASSNSMRYYIFFKLFFNGMMWQRFIVLA